MKNQASKEGERLRKLKEDAARRAEDVEDIKKYYCRKVVKGVFLTSPFSSIFLINIYCTGGTCHACFLTTESGGFGSSVL